MGARDPFELLIEERDLEPREGTFPSGNRWRGIYSRQRDPATGDPVYRYAFGEWWGEPSFKKAIAWVLLNPSIGDTDGKPRPVLGYCRNRSMDWGHAGIVIVNLFAYRARDPKRLRSLHPEDAQGPDNDRALELITAACGRTVAAWGNGGVLGDRGKTVRRVLSEPYCLVKNGQVLSGKGQPFFPRGISTDARLVPLPRRDAKPSEFTAGPSSRREPRPVRQPANICTMTFNEMLNALLDLIGEQVDAQVLSRRDNIPVLVAAMTGRLTAALPLDFDEEGGPDEAIHVAIGDGGALVLNRWAYAGASADNAGLTIELGGVELHLSRTRPS